MTEELSPPGPARRRRCR